MGWGVRGTGPWVKQRAHSKNNESADYEVKDGTEDKRQHGLFVYHLHINECVELCYQGCPCQYLSPVPDMKHSSSFAVCLGEESSKKHNKQQHAPFTTPAFLTYIKALQPSIHIQPTHPAHIAALSQHLVSFEQVVSHQLADFILSLPPSLDHLHLCLRGGLPLKVLLIWNR